MAHVKRCFFIVWVMLVHIGVCNGQVADATFEKALYSLLSLKTSETDSLISLTSPSEKAYLKHYRFFLNQIACDSPYSDYDDLFNITVDKLKESKKQDKRISVFLSEVCLQKGIIAYREGSYMTALTQFISAHQHWRDSEKSHAGLPSNLKLKGIFNLLMSNMPHPYKTWARWIGFKGNNELGFKCLNDYYDKTQKLKGSNQEALVYLAFAHLKFNGEPEKTFELLKPHTERGLPAITKSVLIRCALKIRRPELTKQWLSGKNENFLTLRYLKGKVAVLNQDSLAKKYLLGFILEKKSGQFVADAYRYLSWQQLLEGDSVNYLALQQEILKLDKFPTWEDKQAKYESKLYNWPNKNLLRARLLFDAGKFQMAINTLLRVPSQETLPRNSQVEFQYRLGRCYHLLQDSTKAVFHYTEAISLGDDDKRYFAPYAALYNAQFSFPDNLSKVGFFLEEAKRLNNGEHKKSIQQKIDFLQEKVDKTR